jgi:hypothetical protein
MTTRTFGGALLALALLGSAACAKETSGFQAGVDPWETEASTPAVEWPAWPSAPGPVAVVTGSRLANGDVPAHFWAHGRVVLEAPIAEVWAALQWQPGVVVAVYPDDQVDCTPTNQVESGYDLSFAVQEIPKGGQLYRANWFKVNWRANATRDGSQAVAKVNVRAQKVYGTPYIELMRQSAVLAPAPGGGTQVEIVRHINAPGESETTAGDWIRLWVDALDAQAKGTPLLPLTRCAFP